MKGVPGTPSLVAIHRIAYTVPEIFRLVASPADTVELHPLPILVHAKRDWHDWARGCSYALCVWSLFPAALIWFSQVIPKISSKLNLITLSLTLSSICTIFIVVSWKMLFRTRFFAHCKTTLSEAGCLTVLMSTCYGVASRLLMDMFALDAPTRMTGPGIILVVCLALCLVSPLSRSLGMGTLTSVPSLQTRSFCIVSSLFWLTYPYSFFICSHHCCSLQ
jgi:hypothetical protein